MLTLTRPYGLIFGKEDGGDCGGVCADGRTGGLPGTGVRGRCTGADGERPQSTDDGTQQYGAVAA